MSQGLRTGEPSTFQAERQEEPSPHGRPSAGPGCTALRPTGSAGRGPLPSKSHSQVGSSPPGGEEAAGRSPEPQQRPSPAQGSPDPASFSPRGGAQQQAAPLTLSLGLRDIPEGSSMVWVALHKQAGLPHPALMWGPLPTLQEAQQAPGPPSGTRLGLRARAAAALAHLSLSSAAFSASSSFCRAVARRSWARSNSSSTSWMRRFRDATSASAWGERKG